MFTDIEKDDLQLPEAARFFLFAFLIQSATLRMNLSFDTALLLSTAYLF
jgi:hypothetical protein